MSDKNDEPYFKITQHDDGNTTSYKNNISRYTMTSAEEKNDMYEAEANRKAVGWPLYNYMSCKALNDMDQWSG